jgi:hypothetical protein
MDYQITYGYQIARCFVAVKCHGVVARTILQKKDRTDKQHKSENIRVSISR